MFNAPKRPSVSVETTDPGADDKVVEINPSQYGDAFDPTGVTRVRTAPWDMDTDNDGDKN
jgi:hypothetical protein